MLSELLALNVDEMTPGEMEEECMQLEDAYAEALKDNVDFSALNKIWMRIQELKACVEKNNYAM
jgi:hypothetical protein